MRSGKPLVKCRSVSTFSIWAILACTMPLRAPFHGLWRCRFVGRLHDGACCAVRSTDKRPRTFHDRSSPAASKVTTAHHPLLIVADHAAHRREAPRSGHNSSNRVSSQYVRLERRKGHSIFSNEQRYFNAYRSSNKSLPNLGSLGWR
jgi:hypothetical protein